MAFPRVTLLRAAIALTACAALVLFLMKRQRDGAASIEACASTHADALAVLFIGNSHTFTNDLPRMFCDLGAEERALRVRSVTAPGWSLAQHSADGTALRAIREEGPWTHVVLQEYSALPLVDPREFEASVKRFAEVARAAGARPVLFELWPRRDTQQDAAALRRAYADVARNTDTLLVPVGAAWTLVESGPGRVELFQPDGWHAAPAGTYLAACVFLRTLLGRSPEGKAPIPGMSRELALALQRSARQSADGP